VECRADEVDTEHVLASALDDEATRSAVTAERAVLATLQAGCTAPVGALGDVVEDLDSAGTAVHRLSLRAVAAGADGGILRATGVCDLGQAQRLGAELAEELLESGAAVPSDPGR
jgi:hydroxymethylbilane synthase